jgi:hypothetical protein
VVTPTPVPADTERVEKKLRVVSEPPEPVSSPYDEWGRLTRFLKSARTAFARERDLWASLGIDDPEQVRIALPEERNPVALHHHIAAVSDSEPLHGTVLVQSYALVESAAAEKLATPQRSLGKIEEWGTKLLASNDRDWSTVEGDRAGAVEVAVMRNAFAHGLRSIDAEAHARLLDAGARTRPVGSIVTLTYDELCEYRRRLRSLLNKSGIGH